MTILDVLKSTATAQHEHVEALLALDGESLTRARYTSILSAFRALYAPLEARLDRAFERDATTWRHADFSPAARRKLPLLDRDLAALDLATPTDAPPDALPAIDDVAAALGALYVLEGATLGGRVIGRQLHAALGVDPFSGAAFFGGYGDATGPMWKAYSAQVTDYVDRFGGHARVLAAGVSAFAAFERWFAPLAVPLSASGDGARG